MRTERFLVAIVVPPATAGFLTSLQRAYALPAAPLPLHITLVPPIDTRADPDRLATLLAPEAARRGSFPIDLDGLGSFPNTNAIFHARVSVSRQLKELATDLKNALRPLATGRYDDGDYPFAPHVTLARATRALVAGWLVRMQNEPIRHEFTCDRFHLLRLHQAAHRWEVIREFRMTE